MMKVASGEADKIFNDIHNLLLPGGGGAVYPEINYPNSEVTISKKYRYVGKEGQIEQTTITHSFKGYTTTVYIENFGFRTGRQFLMANILWGGARAGKISEAIPGPKGSENAVLNSFNNFISEQLNYNEKEKDFSKTNGYGKAFRHQLWQGIIANIFGESFAEDLGDSQERGNIYGNNEDDKQRAFRDLINNEYGRQLGLSFQGDIETIDGLVEFLNIIANNIITSFEELSNAITIEERENNKFTKDTPGVQELFDAINTSNIDAIRDYIR
ncbi:MAG: hypothetical protein IAE67_10580 [Candidatus Competibacteraceae bacterium]|nr:hypothetical protein [Candidatus Competibacteraceae bacterium]